MNSDSSIIGTPNGVIAAKTVKRLSQKISDGALRAVLNMGGIPSNPVPGAGGDHIPIEASGTRHTERGEVEHAAAPEREKCDTRSTVAALDPTVRRMCMTRSHIRQCGVTEGCPRCKWIEVGRSMPQDGREGLKKEEQRRPELRRAEEKY